MLKNVSYQTRLLLTYSAIIATLFVSFIGVYYLTQVNSLKLTMQSALVQLTAKAYDQLSSLLGDMSRISLGVASSAEVWDALSGAASDGAGEDYFYSHPQEKDKIESVLVALNGMRFNSRSLNVISMNYDYLCLNIYDNVKLRKSQVAQIPWIKHVLEHGVSKYLSPVSKDMYGNTDNETFSFVRLIQSNFRKYGIVDVQFERGYLDEIFDSKISGYPIYAIVENEDGTVFYSTAGGIRWDGGGLIGETAGAAEKVALRSARIAGRDFNVCSSSIGEYGLKMYLLIDSSYYLDPVRMATLGIVGGALILLLLLMLLVSMVTQRLYKPIRQLRDSIDKADSKDWAVDFGPANTNDEIAQLSSAFNRLISGIRKSSEDLMQSRMREIKANYNTLQAQLNPHFMSNILTVIGMMGRQRGVPEIMDICSSLTKMLSYSTSLAKPVTVVQSEVEHAREYLVLMKYRYLDHLDYSIEVDARLLQRSIPRFVLQPIVENCFQHSFENSEPPYKVRMNGEISKNGWRICVEDNGSGFPPEVLERLRGQFEMVKRDLEEGEFSSDLSTGGLALINTFARLHIYSGGEIGITVSNRDEGGSRVVIGETRVSQ